MAGKSVHDLSMTISHEHEHEYSSDVEEIEGLAATSDITSSLLTEIDALEKAERESAEAFRLQQQQSEEAFRMQEQRRQRHIDTLRKLARHSDTILHQQHVARQKARIKRLQKTATEAAEGTPATVKQAEPKKSIATAASTAASTPIATVVATPLAAKVATTSATKANTSASISTTKAATASASRPSTAAAAAPQALRDAQQDTTMAMDDDDDADYYTLPLPPPAQAAPVAPMTVEAPKATPKPLIPPSKQTKQGGGTTGGSASETSAAATSKPPRPVQKMVPSRGRPTRGRGISRGRIAISSSSSSSSSSNGSPEPEEVPNIPRRGGLGVTGRRSRPYKRGGTTRASVSSVDEDEETQFTPIIPSSRKPGFTAVNTPRTWADDHGLEAENRAISSFPAGAGPASTKKPIPPAKRVDQVALFTPKDLRGIYGGGNPGLICATVKAEDIARAVIRTRNYICLSPDAHFKPPGTICDNAEMLDIYGQDDPIDRRVATVPVLRKVDKLWMYCGNYKVGDRRMVTLPEWREGGENVKKHWAKKVQDTEWGREWLVRKGWLVHGEIRNVSLDEILGYFRISDDKKGLRFSSTALHFHEYDNVSYNKMVDFCSRNHPNDNPHARLSTLKSNHLILPAPSKNTNKSHLTTPPDPTPSNKRRRQEGPAPTSVRTITTASTAGRGSTVTTTSSSAGRGARRVSRNVIDYRIAPMNEFSTEEGGKGRDDFVDLDSDESEGGNGGEEDDDDDDDEEEEEEEEEEGSGDEDVMVLE
ncbi:uncharacterized protein H6S33_006080 [Morchella sextelata]|uniref:uncharacterized protein n=1 Tax=Morchella sextelata TaxID=1174677 RepID=UPI001D0383E4|nr:uncharacterized protein H6S33_006080 [Morchella sextelata]KAH0614194.1 hypothetical protein H6S33_006080 [Morchella sextelata]